MAPRTTSSASALALYQPPRLPTAPPLSVRSGIQKRRRLRNRTQPQKLSRGKGYTWRPVEAVPSSSLGKQPSVWKSVPSLGSDDVVPMEVCIEEDWNELPEIYILDGDKKVGPEMWPVCMEVDGPEDWDLDEMILDECEAAMEELRNGVEDMDLDNIPPCQENQIFGFGYCPMEGVELEVQGQSFRDITSRQFTGNITMQIQLSIEMQLQEGPIVQETVRLNSITEDI